MTEELKRIANLEARIVRLEKRVADLEYSRTVQQPWQPNQPSMPFPAYPWMPIAQPAPVLHPPYVFTSDTSIPLMNELQQ